MKNPSKGLLLSSLAWLSLAGCFQPDVERFDEGKLCLYAHAPESPGMAGPAQDFAVGEPLFASVSTEDCISACIENELATCAVRVAGNLITVHSELSWDEPPGEQVCIALCGSLGAVCTSGPLAAGVYTVTHGGELRVLSVPSTNIAPCGG